MDVSQSITTISPLCSLGQSFFGSGYSLLWSAILWLGFWKGLLIIIGIVVWIFFEIESGDNDLQNIILYTNLGENVSITKNKNITSGNFTINQNNQITWLIQNIEKNQKNKLAFEVSFVPNESSVGKIVNIIENTTIIADDELCKKQISVLGENINTNLKYDTYAKNKGIVQK